MNVLKLDDLASFLERPELNSSQRARVVVDLVNGLIAEKWAQPANPVPTSVLSLAYTIAERALGTTPGRGRLESITRSIDDGSRTERYAAVTAHPDGHAVYITDAEVADLNGVAGVAADGDFFGSFSVA